MPAFCFVDRPDRMLEVLEARKDVGIDTEFMRERTYFSQLCLVQVSTEDAIYCVDPLVEDSLEEFWQAVFAPDWILHSGRQDIEVVYQAAGHMPSRLFDTQIAAALLGYQPQIGYANLVAELFDVELPKTHTRADWSRRPLSQKYLEYAAEDVEYLLPARDRLTDELEQKGRLDWALADSAELLDRSLYDINTADAVSRVKGARNLRGPKRAAAVRLAEWRETEAVARDRPRQWILRDSILLEIASRLPRNRKQLARIDGMPSKLVARAGDDLLAAVAAAVDDGSDYSPPTPPDEAQKALLKKMQRVVAACADELGIAPETIASKKELSAVIIGGQRDTRLFRDWRGELIGEQLKALL